MQPPNATSCSKERSHSCRSARVSWFRVRQWAAGILLLWANGIGHAAPPSYDLTTPQRAWTSVLDALETGRATDARSVMTPNALASIGDATDSARLVARARGWRRMEIRWQEHGIDRARALLGPRIKEQTLEFTRSQDRWLLDRWSPGE